MHAGYEEAAAQGLVAGMNAARLAAGLSPVALPRNSSYIGTLIDDLVTKDLREPYRCGCVIQKAVQPFTEEKRPRHCVLPYLARAQ